jgi:DNA-binding transcriptional ArsR family regulator
MSSTFAILAEPSRRAILGQLAAAERSVGELEHRLRMPQTSVSKHLRVLREAGFVEARIEAQRRVYRLRPEPLMEVDAWLSQFRRFWSARVDALEQHLDKLAAARARGPSPQAAQPSPQAQPAAPKAQRKAPQARRRDGRS